VSASRAERPGGAGFIAEGARPPVRAAAPSPFEHHALRCDADGWLRLERVITVDQLLAMDERIRNANKRIPDPRHEPKAWRP